MPSRNANDATWYVLRYAEDFTAPGGAPSDETAPFALPSEPYLQSTLLFDDRRGVLELQPQASEFEADLPTGLATDISGDIYRVDRQGILAVLRCDGSIEPLLCEPGTLLHPAGLALDRRGFLYVADPAARRVAVISPDDRSVIAILGGGGPVGVLSEPVDVAIAPGGRVYVADREGGRIAVFSAGMKPLTSFSTAAAAGKTPRPIAVMVDEEGRMLVADAWLPRLLRYQPDGTRIADLDLSSLLAPLSGGIPTLGAFRRAYGERLPRFLVGTCGPCAAPENDGGARLAEMHRAVRLLALSLGRHFAAEGVFISRALDGGRNGVPWHRIEVEFNGDASPDTEVLVETFTSDDPEPPPEQRRFVARGDQPALPFSETVPEQLVFSPRGRYLWLRLTLRSGDGQGTPSVRAIRAYYPRVSYLDLLPAAYRSDPEAAGFLDHFLALFEHVFTGIEDRYEEFSRELNPDAAPREVIDWLAALMDLAFDPSWPIEKRRALVGEAMALYRTRGTVAGIERYVEVYTGRRPVIVEGWLQRPVRPAFLGRPGSVLGCGLPLLGGGASPTVLPDDELWARYAHRFTIFVYLGDPCDAEVTTRAVDRIVEVNKPAHTVHRSEVVYAAARVGVQSRVGLDLVLGAAGAPATELAAGSREDKGRASAVIRAGTVLGGPRPGYVRRLDGHGRRLD